MKEEECDCALMELMIIHYVLVQVVDLDNVKIVFVKLEITSCVLVIIV